MSSAAVASDRSGLTFRLACWVLGLIAFLQLLVAAVALARRVEGARVVRVEERVITEVVEVPVEVPAAAKDPEGPVVAIPPPPEVPKEKPLPPARPLDAPPIADPVVERLVNEGREARVAEDMGRAIPALNEALARNPAEPNALFELALAYETMAAYDASLASKAGECYEKVFRLGTDAGALYPLAARKLEEGIALPADMRGKLSLGRVRIFEDAQYSDGTRVVLTVPVNSAPGEEPGADDFLVVVHFYDKSANGVPQPVGPECERTFEWVSGAIDWVGGQELLQVTYLQRDPSNPGEQHLFGRSGYYGQVVELFYRNELIDTQAWPRHLASRSQGEPQQGLDPLFLDEEFLPGPGLLPPLEDELLPEIDEP